MAVKCGNKRVHGYHANVYHSTAADVKACFGGQTVAPSRGVSIPATSVGDRRYLRSVILAWQENARDNEFWDGEIQIARAAMFSFFQQRGIVLDDDQLDPTCAVWRANGLI